MSTLVTRPIGGLARDAAALQAREIAQSVRVALPDGPEPRTDRRPDRHQFARMMRENPRMK